MATESFPPAGFIEVQSAVEGITVYKPAPPPEQKEDAVIDFLCPRCGAKTAFSASAGGLTCSACGYHEPPKKEAVGKAAEQFEFKAEVLDRTATGWGEHREQITCQRCHAVTVLVPGQLTVSCPFCSSNSVVQEKASQDMIRPRFLIPFKLEADGLQAIAGKWLGSSWMTPGKLRNLARLGEFSGIYLPFWTFDARAQAEWKAEVGYDRTERYYDNGEWKTRTVTDWRRQSGSVVQTFDDVLVTGTTHVSGGILSQINNFDLMALAEYEPKFLAGWKAQAYEIELEPAWADGRSVMRERTQAACRADALSGGGDRLRNFTMTLNFGNEAWRYILLPTYLAAYTYNDKVYQIVVNGQSGAIGGSRPVDWPKVSVVGVAMFIPACLVALLALAVGSDFLFFVTLGFGLLAFAGVAWLFTTAAGIANPDASLPAQADVRNLPAGRTVADFMENINSGQALR